MTHKKTFIDMLRNLVNKIDKNHDGFVNQNELRNWIRLQHKSINQKHTDKIWSKYNSDYDDHLTFDELLDSTIGAPETCLYLLIVSFR